jgi:hypothetical protein
VLDGTDALLRRLKVGEPPPPGSVPGRPFDITEYTQAAATIGDAAKQLQTLVTMLDHDAPAATLLSEAMRGHAERVVDHLYKRVIEAFGVLFVARAADRAHLAATRSASGTAGCKKNLCGGQGALILASEPWRGPCEAVAKRIIHRPEALTGGDVMWLRDCREASEVLVVDRCLGSDKWPLV